MILLKIKISQMKTIDAPLKKAGDEFYFYTLSNEQLIELIISTYEKHLKDKVKIGKENDPS